jgi:hypothetical protein
MQWNDLPSSENVEDRRADPVPWWDYLGMEASPQDVFGRMVESLRNPLTPPTNGPRGASSQGWDQRVPPPVNPGPLELGLGLNDIGGASRAPPLPPANMLAQMLFAEPRQPPIFPRDMIAILMGTRR